LKVQTQTAHVLALAFGLVPADRVSMTADRLAARVASNGYRMATGFLGTRDILPALSQHGHFDLAVRLFQSRKFPSWGYEVVNGATTVWERWDSYTKEHGFNGAEGNQNASMNSFSHYAFGAITAWMFRDLAGIDTEGEGYRRIRIRPGVPSAGQQSRCAAGGLGPGGVRQHPGDDSQRLAPDGPRPGRGDHDSAQHRCHGGLAGGIGGNGERRRETVEPGSGCAGAVRAWG
jgi:hypothetical protein